jgi:hypothetical protein
VHIADRGPIPYRREIGQRGYKWNIRGYFIDALELAGLLSCRCLVFGVGMRRRPFVGSLMKALSKVGSLNFDILWRPQQRRHVPKHVPSIGTPLAPAISQESCAPYCTISRVHQAAIYQQRCTSETAEQLSPAEIQSLDCCGRLAAGLPLDS